MTGMFFYPALLFQTTLFIVFLSFLCALGKKFWAVKMETALAFEKTRHFPNFLSTIKIFESPYFLGEYNYIEITL